LENSSDIETPLGKPIVVAFPANGGWNSARKQAAATTKGGIKNVTAMAAEQYFEFY
jgi:hypothetical protein